MTAHGSATLGRCIGVRPTDASTYAFRYAEALGHGRPGYGPTSRHTFTDPELAAVSAVHRNPMALGDATPWLRLIARGATSPGRWLVLWTHRGQPTAGTAHDDDLLLGLLDSLERQGHAVMHIVDLHRARAIVADAVTTRA